eukprot:TRINITY_DN12169_c0_g2_i2.p7 TRINITY_DN12169_c0_g2~~TRINITY_DN12169_c0_g2_i2.p7  ORF type:complete len:177 (-),score=15.19 TRINITY_DN12169_c0_g2_i2:2730-3260(-)
MQQRMNNDVQGSYATNEPFYKQPSNNRMDYIQTNDNLIIPLRRNGKTSDGIHGSSFESEIQPELFSRKRSSKKLQQQQQQYLNQTQSTQQSSSSSKSAPQQQRQQQKQSQQQQSQPRQIRKNASILQYKINLLNTYLKQREEEDIRLEQLKNPFWIEDDLSSIPEKLESQHDEPKI